jgi:hypothetical protein
MSGGGTIDISSNCILAKLTRERSARIKENPACLDMRQKDGVNLTESKVGEWFLGPDDSVRKSQGERHIKHYLGKIVTII